MRWALIALLWSMCDGGRAIFPDEVFIDSGGDGILDCTVLEPTTLSFTAEDAGPKVAAVTLGAECELEHAVQVASTKLDDPAGTFEIVDVVKASDSRVEIGLRMKATEPGSYEGQLVVETGVEGQLQLRTQLFGVVE